MTNEQLALIGIIFIFMMTVLGSSVVFFFKKEIKENYTKAFLGFAAGVMIAASVWSLIVPSLEQARELGLIEWIPAAIGFLAGGLFLLLLDFIIPHLHVGSTDSEGLHSNFKKVTKLFLAVTMHNIPEGLAVGLAFGLALNSGTPTAGWSALGLAIGIGLQNLPEGAAVALPMKMETKSATKSFIYGSLSGFVEPIAAVIGIILASQLVAVMPWLLAFAAGAMIYVTVEELIPEAHLGEHTHFGTWGVMIGFIIMMILDVALG